MGRRINKFIIVVIVNIFKLYNYKLKVRIYRDNFMI